MLYYKWKKPLQVDEEFVAMSIINTGSEKRRFKRAGLDTPVRYNFKHTNEFGSTITKDISEGGVKIVLDKFVPLNTNVVLEFAPDKLTNMVNAVGRVVWSRLIPYSERYQLGIEFQEINEHYRQGISEYVKSRRF